MHQRAELAGQFPQLAKLLKLLFLQATRQLQPGRRIVRMTSRIIHTPSSGLTLYTA
ncbi:hypothetical protein LNO03_13320 [Klebsiella pneumoniae subsp. pneumoniae]|nr:hypothetical protein [Klebsiella pneumoniae subsp. pneumoniae]